MCVIIFIEISMKFWMFDEDFQIWNSCIVDIVDICLILIYW